MVRLYQPLHERPTLGYCVKLPLEAGEERASRADLGKVKRILKRAGKGKPPVAGDEIA
jgi:hypothetical protein